MGLDIFIGFINIIYYFVIYIFRLYEKRNGERRISLGVGFLGSIEFEVVVVGFFFFCYGGGWCFRF